MKLIPEKLEELKAMAEHARSPFSIDLAEAFVNYVPALITALEEAQRRISISEAFAKELSSELITARKQLAESERRYSESVGGFKRDLQQKLDDQRSKNVRLKAKIAESQDLIEAYRKDAACWRFARKNLLWREVGDDHIRWSMELAMTEPDLGCSILSNDSVARALDAAVHAAIAAKVENE